MLFCLGDGNNVLLVEMRICRLTGGVEAYHHGEGYGGEIQSPSCRQACRMKLLRLRRDYICLPGLCPLYVKVLFVYVGNILFAGTGV